MIIVVIPGRRRGAMVMVTGRTVEVPPGRMAAVTPEPLKVAAVAPVKATPRIIAVIELPAVVTTALYGRASLPNSITSGTLIVPLLVRMLR